MSWLVAPSLQKRDFHAVAETIIDFSALIPGGLSLRSLWNLFDFDALGSLVSFFSSSNGTRGVANLI